MFMIRRAPRVLLLAATLALAVVFPANAAAQQAESAAPAKKATPAPVPPKDAPAAASGLLRTAKPPAAPASPEAAKDPLAEAAAAAAAAAAVDTPDEASPEQQLQRYLENEVSQKLTRSTEPGGEPPFEKRPFDSPGGESRTTGPVSYANELTEGLCREVVAHHTCKESSQFCLTSVRDDVHKYNVFYGTDYTDFYCKVGPESLAITSRVWKKQIISTRYRAKGGCVEAEVAASPCAARRMLRYCKGGATPVTKKQNGG